MGRGGGGGTVVVVGRWWWWCVGGDMVVELVVVGRCTAIRMHYIAVVPLHHYTDAHHCCLPLQVLTSGQLGATAEAALPSLQEQLAQLAAQLADVRGDGVTPPDAVMVSRPLTR